MGQTFDSIVIKAGAVVPRTVTGLRVRYDQPLTLGGSQYAMQPLPSGSLGYLAPTGSWAKRAEGAFMLVAPGKVKITNAVDAAPTELTLDEGKLNEVVLPTAKASVQVDAYDAAYPTPTSCSAPVLVSGGQSTPVRDQAGNAIPTAVIPHGARATAAVQAYGMSKSIPTAAGQTHSFLLNRLEVDDVEVNAAGGGTQYVKGVFNVEYKDAGGVYRPLVCGNFATHTGIDLLDGSYRVTSRANSPSGVVTHVEEISFP